MALAMERAPISFARDELTLAELIAEAQAAYELELAIPMTVSRPPELRRRDGSGAWSPEAEPGAQIGLSMSKALITRLDGPRAAGRDDETGGYTALFPVAAGLDDLRGWCRGKHLEPRGGPWLNHVRDLTAGSALWRRLDGYRPLCARLAFYTVVHGVPLSRLAAVEQVETDQAEELLEQALRHVWRQRAEWAYADTSGVGELFAQQRRERRRERQAREVASQRAAQVRAGGGVCRYCHQPFDPNSQSPCGSQPAGLVSEIGLVLCSPTVPA